MSGPAAAPESGWKRIITTITIRPGEAPPNELVELANAILAASFGGFLFGGFVGARHAGDRFILMNSNAKFSSTMQAQRQLHAASMMGFIRHGCKWGWKMAAFAAIFSGTHSLLTLYRNRDDVLNYVGAGGLTGCLFRVSAGLKPAIGGTALGMLLSFPIGMLMHGLDLTLGGGKERERVRLERLKARADMEEQWKAKLGATTGLIDAIEKELQPVLNNAGLQDYYMINPSQDASLAESDSASADVNVHDKK